MFVLIMALILGHSQVKYMHEYSVSYSIVTMCYPGFRIIDFIDWKIVSELVPPFPVRSSIFNVCACVRVCVCETRLCKFDLH